MPIVADGAGRRRDRRQRRDLGRRGPGARPDRRRPRPPRRSRRRRTAPRTSRRRAVDGSGRRDLCSTRPASSSTPAGATGPARSSCTSTRPTSCTSSRAPRPWSPAARCASARGRPRRAPRGGGRGRHAPRDRRGRRARDPARRPAPVHRGLRPVPVLRREGRARDGRLATHAARRPFPGPPELLPGRPDAVVDLQTTEGAALVGGPLALRRRARRGDRLRRSGGPGAPDPLGPGDRPNRTYDVLPHAQACRLRRLGWRPSRPSETRRRLANGRVCFNWYRTERHDPRADRRPRPHRRDRRLRGRRRRLRRGLGRRAAAARARPDRRAGRRRLQRAQPRRAHARRAPGQRFAIAVFGINGPISASPRNYIWMRSATLDLYAAERARQPSRPSSSSASTRGSTSSSLDATRSSGSPAASSSPRGRCGRPTARCCSPRRTRTSIYRSIPSSAASRVFRTKSGYAGIDIGRYHQPGSNGLAFCPEGRLTICQHGNRRVLRVEPHGNMTVLADRFQGRRLNSPNDLVYRVRRHALLHRPAVRAARRARRPGARAAVQRRFAVRDGDGHARHRRARRARTASRSRPTSASSTSATGTPSARS